MSDIDDLCQIIHRGIGLNFEDLAEEIIAAGFHRDCTATDIADAVLAAGCPLPARIIETVEELNALPVGTVVVEGDHATPDEVVFGGLMTMPGVFHRFHEGWHVVAGHGARPVPLPVTVLWEPGAGDE